MEFEYLKVPQATGPELEYLRVGVGVYPGISSHGPGISIDEDGIEVCQGYLEFEYLKLRGWKWSISRYFKLRVSQGISSYGGGI